MKFLICISLLFGLGILQIKANDRFGDTLLVKKKSSFEKSIFIGYDFQERVLIGFSGPQLLFSLNKNLKLGPSYFPALWWNHKSGETDTKLGVGIRVDYKTSMIAFNTFRVSNIWVGSLVLGCKF